MTDYLNCACNICSSLMHHDRPNSHDKFCSVACRKIDGVFYESEMKKRWKDHGIAVRKISGVRPVFSLTPWPKCRKIEYGWHPSRMLRLRGNHVTSKVPNGKC